MRIYNVTIPLTPGTPIPISEGFPGIPHACEIRFRSAYQNQGQTTCVGTSQMNIPASKDTGVVCIINFSQPEDYANYVDFSGQNGFDLSTIYIDGDDDVEGDAVGSNHFR